MLCFLAVKVVIPIDSLAFRRHGALMIFSVNTSSIIA